MRSLLSTPIRHLDTVYAWWAARRGAARLRIIPVLVLLAAFVGACGPLGDDDEDPTATAPPVPAGTTSQTAGATPAASPGATPRVVPGAGTPRAGSPPTPASVVDADAAETPDDAAAEGTGTTAEPGRTPAADDETPSADDNGTEPTEGAEPTTVVVADCEEPEELPERTGRQNRVVADEGLRLRGGPGTSCDEITSLSLDTPVRVISGVVEAEDDDIEWVKVDVDGTEGWVAVEFLENPPAE